MSTCIAKTSTAHRPNPARPRSAACICGLILTFGPAAVAADDDTVGAWPDNDGDGYATISLSVSSQQEVDAPGGELPSGWTDKRGDYDDNDPSIHPRQPEQPFNGIDDDCDELIDEPAFRYARYGRGITTTGFDMNVIVKDGDTAWDVFGNDAWYRIEYQDLGNTRYTHQTDWRVVSGYSIVDGEVRVTLELDGLDRGTVYRARVQFGAIWSSGNMGFTVPSPAGDVSDWYYSCTDGNGSVGHARSRIVNRGFYEYDLSEHAGAVGHLGWDDVDGTKYTADEDEAWCSEFYYWVVDKELLIGLNEFPLVPVITYYDHLITYFQLFGEYQPVSMIGYLLDARRGDYLAIDRGDGDINHSCMFLAFDWYTLDIWTLDGNGSGRSVDPATGNDRSRKGGNEVVVRVTPWTDIAGLGSICSAMLE